MKSQIRRVFLVMSFCLLSLTNLTVLHADSTQTLTVHHVDAYGAPIADDDYFVGNTSDRVTLEKRGGAYYTTNSSLTYTFTSETTQTYTIKYNPVVVRGSSGFHSIYVDTTLSESMYNSNTGDFDGNVGYFRNLENEALRFQYCYSSLLYSAPTLNRVLDVMITVPKDKLSISDSISTRIYIETADIGTYLYFDMLDSTHEGELDLEELGITVEHLFSEDNGSTYKRYNEIDNTKITNIVSRLKFSKELRSSDRNRIYVINEYTSSIVEDHLTADELNGITPITGFKYKAENLSSTSTVNIATKIHMISPTISGQVRTQESGELNWNDASALPEKTVTLVDSTGSQTTNTVQTDIDGNFSFNQSFANYEDFKTIVTASGYTPYIYYINENNQEVYLPGNEIDSTILAGLFSQPISGIIWKADSGSKYAMSTQDIKFLLVKLEDVPEQVNHFVTYHEDTETSGSVPIDGILYTNGDRVIVKDHGTLTKEGYTFAGWITQGRENIVLLPGDSFIIIQNTHFYAKWELDDTNQPEPTIPTEPAEPTEPIEPAVPTEPIVPTDPINPTKPTEPIVPTTPIEPVVPIEPSEPNTDLPNTGFVSPRVKSTTFIMLLGCFILLVSLKKKKQ